MEFPASERRRLALATAHDHARKILWVMTLSSSRRSALSEPPSPSHSFPVMMSFWWCCTTLSAGWGRGGTPRRLKSQATLQGLNQTPKIKNRECRAKDIWVRVQRQDSREDDWRHEEDGHRRCKEELSWRLILRREDESKRLWLWQQRRESWQRMRRWRTSSCGETGRDWTVEMEVRTGLLQKLQNQIRHFSRTSLANFPGLFKVFFTGLKI